MPRCAHRALTTAAQSGVWCADRSLDRDAGRRPLGGPGGRPHWTIKFGRNHKKIRLRSDYGKIRFRSRYETILSGRNHAGGSGGAAGMVMVNSAPVWGELAT